MERRVVIPPKLIVTGVVVLCGLYRANLYNYLFFKGITESCERITGYSAGEFMKDSALFTASSTGVIHMRKILIVDDEWLTGLEIEEMLTGLGYDVVGQAKTGVEAVDMVRNLEPDLVIMDVMMPGEMNGIDAARVIKAEWGTPIIFVSGYGDPEYIEAAKEIAPFGYVMKPFDEREVHAFVEIALSKRKLELKLKKAHERLERTNLELRGEIEARKITERTLQEREKLYRDIFERNKAIKWVLDPSTGKIIDANPAACEFYQYSHEALTDLHIWDINVLDEVVLRKLIASAESDEQTEFTFKHRRASGEIRDVQVYTGTVEFSGKKLLHSIIIDITDRQRAEEALRASEARFRSLVETTSDWVWEVDPEGIYTYVNPRVKDALGYEPEEVIGKRPFDFMPPAEAERIERVFQAMAASGDAIERLENTNLHKDGRPVVLETSGAPFFDAKGNLQGYRGIDRDITERKKVEEALQQTYQDLRNTQARLIQAAKLASIGQLSAGVAHELNQPLMVIRNTAQLIGRAVKKNRLEEDDLNGQLTAIERNTKRMMNIINHLRTFSRQSPLDFHPVDINRVIENTFLMMGEQLRLHDIEVKKDLAANLPRIQGDANQLEQVLLNLLINAGDAIETAGNNRRVEMTTRISDGVKGAIEILIKDTGGGISKECLEKIFDPFFTTKDVGKGTGLGLSISYGIVKDHKGEIEATETGPEGTTFRIRLPIASNEKSGNRK